VAREQDFTGWRNLSAGNRNIIENCHPEPHSSATADERVPKDPDAATALLAVVTLFHNTAEFCSSHLSRARIELLINGF
jgi:hypothetical protein